MGDGEITTAKALALHFLCGVGLAAGYCAARLALNLSLVADPAATLRLLLAIEGPIVIGIYSLIRRDDESCSYWKAVTRGLLALPVGALLNAFGAIVLGAPVSLKYCSCTMYWSCFMSLFTFVPAVCVFGISKMDWQRILAHSKPKEGMDCVVSLPAQGAIIGAWFGAWPMPLDWERPWQVFKTRLNRPVFLVQCLDQTMRADWRIEKEKEEEEERKKSGERGVANLRHIWSNCWLLTRHVSLRGVCIHSKKRYSCQGRLKDVSRFMVSLLVLDDINVHFAELFRC